MTAPAPALALAVIREAPDAAGEPALTDRWFHRLGREALAAGRERRPETLPPATRRVEVALLLADDPTLGRLNREYRSIDRPTDVLAFAQLEGPPTGMAGSARRAVHLGDIAISLERARRQGEAYGHGLLRETAYLFVHGMLHLLGYDHETEADLAAMRGAEEASLGACGLSRAVAAASAT